MKIETYRKNRDLFESKYGRYLTAMGYNRVSKMLHGIRNKHLFMMMYCYDRRIHDVSQAVSSIDKDLRHYLLTGRSFTRIRKSTRKISMIDKFGNYEKLLEACISKLESLRKI